VPLYVRSLLGLVLLACFPLVAVAVAVAVVAVGVVVTDHVAERYGILIIFAGLGILGTLGISFVRALRARPQPVEGPELSRGDAAALWALVDHLAGRMQVRGPERIVVVPDVNAAVYEVRGRREMLIGLPLLGALTRGELASVLAHELGHYSHGHTRLSARTYRWSELALGFLERTPNRVARGILTGYYRLYLLLASSANRAHELQADDWSARLTNPLTAVSALERVGTVRRCWQILTEDYLPLTGPARRRAPLTAGLHELLQTRGEATVPGHPDDGTDGHADGPYGEGKPSPFDTHPPTRERVARFRLLAAAPGGIGAAPAVDPGPAWTLLADPGRMLDELERRLLDDDDPPAGWDEVVQLAGQVESELVATTATRDLSEPTVGDVLAAFAQGRPADVVLPLVRGGLSGPELAEAVPVVGAQVLAAVVHLSLAVDGRARYALSWSGPRRWQLWYGEQGWQDVDLEQLVTPAAHDQAQATALAQTLRSWGARLDLPLKTDAGEDLGTAPQAAWANLVLTGPLEPGGRKPRGGWRVVDLAVYGHGVLLVRPGRAWAASQAGYQRKSAARADDLLQAAGLHPDAYARARGTARDGAPAARWIPESELVGVGHEERVLTASRLTLTLRSGETLQLRDVPATVAMGDPLAELTALCNYR
jgi:Zn-dependent protease with chaperone function